MRTKAPQQRQPDCSRDACAQNSNGLLRVSGKRRRALPEGNPLSNTRKARLHTAADRGEVSASPLFPSVPDDPAPLLNPRLNALLPVVSAPWLRKLPQDPKRSEGSEDAGRGGTP